MAVAFDEVVFDPEARRLWLRDQEIHLPPRTFRLLEALIEARPKALSKQELMDRLWPDVLVQESNLKTVVSELRQALEDTSRPSRYVRTIHRYGYAFCGEAANRSTRASNLAYQLFHGSERYLLREGVNTIGRDAECTIRLRSASISRKHARITIRNERATLEDLESKNGSWVDGTLVTGPVELNDGARIDLAKLSLTFHMDREDELTRTSPGPDFP